MRMTLARLTRTAAPVVVALAAAVLAGCGTTSSSTASPSPSAGVRGSTGATGAGTSPSAAGMGGVMGSSPSAMASGMGSGMGMASAGATGTPAAGAHDAADAAFVMGMIPHHAQAVSMADLAATRARSTQVKALAVAIKAAQGPEITEMSGWLRGWGTPVPTGDVSGMAMTGMMSAADMASLAKLTGTAFDRAWLTMMTSHHQGALAMARTELTAGTNPDAKALARSIITSQTAQISRMKTLLAGLPSS